MNNASISCHALQVDGDVDQSAGMLSEDVKAKGYALLCVSYPQGDCTIQTIEEVRISYRRLRACKQGGA